MNASLVLPARKVVFGQGGGELLSSVASSILDRALDVFGGGASPLWSSSWGLGRSS